jgi:ribosomal protein S18 acetylase RimI-like enzyme
VARLRTAGERLLNSIDAATIRRLMIHEARVHAMPDRELRDLGDSLLLHDPLDPEPFWNRVESLRWPTDPEAFDRRLAEILILFTTLTRQPHVWPTPLHDTPDDLVERLESNGFVDMGAGCVMVLTDTAPASTVVSRGLDRSVTLQRWHQVDAGSLADALGTVVPVLCDAFEVEESRWPGLRHETTASLQNAAFTHYVASVDGEPAAVARRATFDGISYLSSIGTASWARGRGLGELVTLSASADALAAGSDYTYLGVFADNDVARRLYERSGYSMLGAPCPDLLLVG